MNQRDLIKILKELKDLSETSKTWKIESKDKSLLFGELDGPNPDKFLIVIIGRKRIIEFHNKVNKLWKSDIELFNNVTLKTFRLKVVELIRLKLELSESFSKSDFENFKLELLSKPAINREIFKEINGCVITSKEPIELKTFKFYSLPEHVEFIKSRYSVAFQKNEIYFYNPLDKKTLVSTNISAIEFERAVEIADNKFKKLENILRYLLTDTSHANDSCNYYDIGIFDYREQNWLKSVQVTEKT